MKKRALSLLLSLVLLLSVAPFGAFNLTASADMIDGDFTYTVENNEATITDYSGTATELTIPDTLGGFNVTKIGYEAFSGCASLTNITIPNGVVSIDDWAFCLCKNLRSITIPNSVTSIGYEPFNACSNLISITVDNDNNYYSSLDDVLFNKAKTKLIWYPASESAISYTIPNSVTSICDSAFSNCSNLTDITIPSSVASIGDYAFYDCSSLTNITLPNSVTSIDHFAFCGCSGLTSITIPSSVTFMGVQVFDDCFSLSNITVDNDNNCLSSQDGILFNKSKTELLCYPAGKIEISYSIPNGVTSINSGAFSNGSILTSIEIPNSVTEIGSCAFYKCTALKCVTIPNSVTSIGSAAFWDCDALESITIPQGVTSINSHAFSGCTALKYVFYSGTEQDKANITIGSSNEKLTEAAWHYNATDHKYTAEDVSKPATFTEDGTIFKDCGTGSHTDFVSTISRIYWVGFSDHNFEYTGSQITPTVIVTAQDGSTITADNYTVEYNDNVDFGDATATVTFKNKYRGTKTLYFDIYGDIEKATVTNLTNINCFTTPEPVVSYKGKTLVEAVDYTITDVANGLVGTVTIKGNGNYRGTKTVNYSIPDHNYSWVVDIPASCSEEGVQHRVCLNAGCNYLDSWCTPIAAGHKSNSGKITKKATTKATGKKVHSCTDCGTVLKTETLPKLPKTVTAKTVKSPKKATVKITWKKDSKVNGYQIVYATNKKFTKGKKTVTIKGAKTTSKTIKKLKSKKTYYVKIRSYKTVNGKKVYGAFSKVKKVKIK